MIKLSSDVHLSEKKRKEKRKVLLFLKNFGGNDVDLKVRAVVIKWAILMSR